MEANTGRHVSTTQVLYLGSKEAAIRDTLTPAYSVVTAQTVEAAIDALSESAYLVIDKGADSDRIRLLKAAQTRPDVVTTILVVTDPSPDLLQAAVRIGCQDLLFRSESTEETAFPTRLAASLDTLSATHSEPIAETVLQAAQLLISAAPDELATKIEWTLRSIGQRLNAAVCVVYREEDGQLQPTHSWYDTAVFETSPSPVSTDTFPGYEEYIREFTPYWYPTTSETPQPTISSTMVGQTAQIDTPQSPPSYLTERGLESILAVPIVIDWELDGVLVIGRQAEATWQYETRQQIQLFGKLLGGTLNQDRRYRALQEQNDRLERFASVISHDLQNPLNVITGYVELIETTGNPEHVAEIKRATERMEAMLDELLALAQGGDDLGELEPVDLEQLAAEAWQSVKTHTATIDIETLGTVRGDPTRLQQVFENLFRNAIEHGGTDVAVRVETTSEGVAIEDDGPGIPAAKREQIFDEGYTGGGGTGLGLSIVETIIEAHGWTIEATDGTHGGARFEITIPESTTIADL